MLVRVRRQRGAEIEGRGAMERREGRVRVKGSQTIQKGTSIKITEEERGMDEEIQPNVSHKDVQKERRRR